MKKGYSGMKLLSKKLPLSVTPNIGNVSPDQEGRVLTAEYADFYLVNVYVPNAKRDLSRLDYRQQWDRDFAGPASRRCFHGASRAPTMAWDLETARFHAVTSPELRCATA